MPIEALIDRDAGDVIVVKPAGSVWGRCEVNAVMLLDDPALEKELAESGGEHVVYPYAAWEEVAMEGSGVRGQGTAGRGQGSGAGGQESGEKGPVATARRLTHRQLREASLVKVLLTPQQREAMKAISTKPGILHAADADTPVPTVTIAEVKPAPTPTNESSEIMIPNRPLPENK